jgi:hypothetical protein
MIESCLASAKKEIILTMFLSKILSGKLGVLGQEQKLERTIS